MDIAGIQSGMVGMALFDAWEAAVHKSAKARRKHAVGSPLVAAAADAFESYIQATELHMGAQIAGLTTYALSPNGSPTLLTPAQSAPFLALNLLA
jgi:hypothetical protein